MPALKLTNQFVNKVRCNANAGTTKLAFYDSLAPGLMLEVQVSGRKTWFFRYQDSRGKIRQPRLCQAGELTLAKLRKLVLRYRGQLALGQDPFEEKRDKREVPTLEIFIDLHYMPYIRNYKRSWATDDSLLRCHVLPVLGRCYLDEIGKSHILELVYRHRQRHKPATTNRILVLLRYIYNLALKWSIQGVSVNPAAGIPLFEANNERDRFLTVEEVQRLMLAMEQSQNPQLKPMVLMLLLTGARRGEMLAARWEHLDFARKIWTVPKTKAGKVRHIPMSDQLVELLLALREQAQGEYLFVNGSTGKPFTNFFYAWDAARRRAGLPEVRVHDLRHSFASFLVNGGRSLYEVQKILGHTQIKTTQRYAHLSNDSLLAAANQVGQQLGSIAAVNAAPAPLSCMALPPRGN